MSGKNKQCDLIFVKKKKTNTNTYYTNEKFLDISQVFKMTLSILFHRSIFLSLCQYHTVLMTVAL